MTQPRQPRPGQPRPTNVDRSFGGRAPQPPAQGQALDPTKVPLPRAIDTRSLFRRAQEKVSGTRGDGSSKWVSTEQKELWYTMLTPLFLHKIQYRPNAMYGPSYVLHLSEDDPGNPVWFLTMKANDYRDVFFPELMTALESSGQPIGPLMLSKYQVEGQPNPAWDIEEYQEGDPN